MQKDNLPIEQFKSNGKDSRTAQKLDLSLVKKYFEDLGYEVVSIQQPWRNANAYLKKDNQDFFLKLASTSDISELIKNEVSWNEQVKIQLTASDSFTVPTVLSVGDYNGLFYYLAQYFPGQPISPMLPPINPSLSTWLEKIVDCNLSLLNLKTNLLMDVQHEDLVYKKKHLKETWNKFYDQVKEYDLQKLLDDVDLFDKYYEPAVNHYDYVPWHMLADSAKFLLVDAEHASKQGPKYYDVIYFFHRVYTICQAPDIAKKYLSMFKGRLEPLERIKFRDLIKPILASRIIGGFWDAKNHGTVDFSIHEQLKREFLEGSFQ